MSKYLTKEGLGNILNTIVGMKPKNLPARLEKNDIVLHQNRLYKYKGEPKEVRIVNETDFKKVGLRFMGEDYKVTLLNDILELYKWMYQNGLNGHKLENDWGERGKTYIITGKGWDEWGLHIGVTTIEQLANKLSVFGANKVSDIFEFPLKHTYVMEFNIKNEQEEEKNKKQKLYFKEFFSSNTIKNSFINRVNLERNSLREHSRTYRELKEYFLNNNYNFYTWKNQSLYTYEVAKAVLEKVGNFGTYYKEDNENYCFGVYQKNTFETLEIENSNSLFMINSISRNEDSNGNRDYYIDCHINPLFKNNRNRNEIKNYETFRFFLPYFMDVGTNNPEKEMNEKHNKYGVFFQGKEDGEYTLSFKVCMSTRDQHEEDVSGARNWGDMYAFSPTRNKVRQEDETWVVWKKNDLISFELNWKVENGAAKDWKLKLLDENKRNTQGLDNFMKWIQIETFENYLFLQLFYAVYSLDDAGGWNEWQFAHILPPFNLEFKGE